MAHRDIADKVSAAEVAAILDYDPTTGILRWKYRPSAPAGWNTRFAGMPAGCVSPRGYVRVKIMRIGYAAHHLAWVLMNGDWPPRDIDHRDGNPTHNAWDNLRLATISQNMCNSRKRTDNTSGYKGVVRHGRRWLAQIQIERGNRHLGVFDTPEEADAAYRAAALQLHREFARFE